MADGRLLRPVKKEQPDRVWIARCPVPTATGLAQANGWLAEAFGARGIVVSEFTDSFARTQRGTTGREIPLLFREGGNIPALAARRAPSARFPHASAR